MPTLNTVISEQDIQEKVKSLADKISSDYNGKNLVLVGVLKGAFMFFADLVRQLSIPLTIDFVRLASYGGDTKSSGQIKITKDIEFDIKGLDVLIVEDIVDSGLTLSFLVEHLMRFQPGSVKICALIDKKERREKDIIVDYSGFFLKKGFLVGYGLDFNEEYRGLPEISELCFL
ncbi:MAG: hypoxanthine phosphoribosyltransferase [Pseudomonadota bacterium]